MGKDSFIIRKSVTLPNTNAFTQVEIDMGAYVDALGSSIVRVHNISVAYSDTNAGVPNVASECSAQYQLTTQTQTALILASDRSVVATGRLCCDGAGTVPTYTSHDSDVAPQHWTNGYLIATEQLYLGGAASTGFTENVVVSIALECTVEKMSQSAAMALALSQQ